MQIEIKDLSLPAYQTDGWVQKRIPLSVEQVLPDTNADLKQIVWVDSWLQLKGKQLSTSVGTASGLVHATVVYLTESGQLESVVLQRDTSFDFAMDLPDEQLLPQIRWTVTRTEARVLNSRKLALDLEIQAEARVFHASEMTVESSIPEGEPRGLHILAEKTTAVRAFAVTERPFTIREQLRFPPEQRERPQIISETPQLSILGVEQLGSKAIVKGELILRVWHLGEDALPVQTDLRVPFSQLLDIGDTPIAQTSSASLLCSCNTELVETIDGGHALDVEARALLQFAAWTEQDLRYIRDAYSTRSDCVCAWVTRSYVPRYESYLEPLNGEASVAAPEDLAALVQAHVELSSPEAGEDVVKVPGVLDLLYRSAGGELDLARRSFCLTVKCTERPAFPTASLHSVSAEVRDREIVLHLTGCIEWEHSEKGELDTVRSLEIGEEQNVGAQMPAVYLVRANGEDRWTLAKRYRSSVEAIDRLNGPESHVLLIPAEC